MAEVQRIFGAPEPAQGHSCEGPGYHLSFEPLLALARIQILSEKGPAILAAAIGIEAPPPCRQVVSGAMRCAWLGPSEWLITGEERPVADAASRCETLAGPLGLVTRISHASAAWLLDGPGARDLLAAFCPLDLRDSAMPVGAAARSLLAEVGLFVAREADRGGSACYRLIVDQKDAPYVSRLFETFGP